MLPAWPECPRILRSHFVPQRDELMITISFALVHQMEINDVSAPAQNIGDDAEIGPIPVEAAQIVRQGKVSILANHDKILIEARNMNRKGPALVVIKFPPVGDADRT